MTEWEALSRYNYFKMAREDREDFDRWQKSAAVTASIFALVLLAMAVTAWISPGSAPTTVAEATTDGSSTHDMTVRVGHGLSAQETDSPF